jgi:hypothetical protein
MDDIVRQAMAKWPNVPDCYGWLGLDSRGQWWMRDDKAQAMGAFQSGLPGAKGSLLRHEKLIDFIQRNYEVDDQGCWYFQNGPQRVYIELEATPHVWRLSDDFEVHSQTGSVVKADRCLLDETGHVYLSTANGLGLVHTLDVGRLANALDLGLWSLQECVSSELPKLYGYVTSPQVVRLTQQQA